MAREVWLASRSGSAAINGRRSTMQRAKFAGRVQHPNQLALKSNVAKDETEVGQAEGFCCEAVQ